MKALFRSLSRFLGESRALCAAQPACQSWLPGLPWGACLVFGLVSVHPSFAAAPDRELLRALGAGAEGQFRWQASAPLQSPAHRPDDPCFSVKDPTVVRFEERWHLFTTIRSEKRTHQIEYSNFADWPQAATAPRHLLRFNPGYFCAPQVFWFTPHGRWYLLHQASDPSRPVALQPAFSTSTNLADPGSWTEPKFLYDVHPSSVKGWIDFWIICDDQRAHLFFTSNNGLMWRAQTGLKDFPRGWSEPKVVLRDDIFEASHTYRLRGLNSYLTVIEAQAGLRRYYKAYVADRLDGDWQPLAASRENPLAALANIQFQGTPWAESISHGELLRAGYDEKLEIDPRPLRLLFQGATDVEMKGVTYGRIPWRLGLLEPLAKD